MFILEGLIDKGPLLSDHGGHMKLRRLLIFFGILLAVILLVAGYVFIDTPKIALPKKENSVQITLQDNIDWDSLKIELTGILSDLLQIKTVRQDEVKAALYMQKILQKEGIESKLIPHPDRPDKVSLIAEIGPAESDGGLILLNHLDVVEADPKEWSADPFKAEMKNDVIMGRGALDMKGMGAMELVTFLLLNRNQTPLKHKVMFLATPDEESGGKYGVQFLLSKHEDLFDGYDYVLNEGGFGIEDFPYKGDKIFNVQTAEKGILGVDLTAHSDSGHGSMPTADYSSLQMARAVLELQTFQKFKLTDVTTEFFHYLGELFHFPQNFLLQRIQNPIVQKIIGQKLMQNRAMNAMLANTVSVTKLQTETMGPNVIPSEAKAYLDVRLLPGEDPKAFFSEIQKVAAKYNVQADMRESYPPTQSSSDTELYGVLYGILKDNVPDAVVTQYLSPGATDSRFFREKGFECYGIIPILIPMEDLAKLHGKNEDISLQNLVLGTKVLFETVVGYNQLAGTETNQ